MGKITIEDISRYTGLSRGTVSRALNDRPDISPQTKQKVLDACKKLNYVPSAAARSLATGRSYAVAVLVDDLRNPIVAEFLSGVIARSIADRYAVHVLELGPDQPTATGRLRALSLERIDAVLLCALFDGGLAQMMSESPDARPIVAIHPLAGISCDVLAPDHVEVGRLLATHLIPLSGTKTIYITDAMGEDTHARVSGFREAFRGAGLDVNGAVVDLPRRSASGDDRWSAIADRLTGAVGVAADSDALATQAIVALERLGRRVGENVFVAGVGNTLLCELLTPALTSVDLSMAEIGRRAMETALQRISKSRMDAPQSTAVAPLLVARGSTRGGNPPR